jgi:hypothetical protein
MTDDQAWEKYIRGLETQALLDRWADMQANTVPWPIARQIMQEEWDMKAIKRATALRSKWLQPLTK